PVYCHTPNLQVPRMLYVIVILFFVSHTSFILLLHLPLSPLFPYTTLFRSRLPSEFHAVGGPQRRRLVQLRCWYPPSLDQAATLRDRKSTRLNSSHVKISYAVFCLKKKNTTTNSTSTYYRTLTVNVISFNVL